MIPPPSLYPFRRRPRIKIERESEEALGGNIEVFFAILRGVYVNYEHLNAMGRGKGAVFPSLSSSAFVPSAFHGYCIKVDTFIRGNIKKSL